MEPVRGSNLVNLGDNEKLLRELRPSATNVEWAFRFLQTFSDIGVVLSGMSNMAQLKENIETFSSKKPLNEKEINALSVIADNMLKEKTVPCTGCRYCTTYCPQKLDIPNLMHTYNENNFTNGWFSGFIFKTMKEDEKPHNCLGCKACEAVCPQGIKISEIMASLKKCE